MSFTRIAALLVSLGLAGCASAAPPELLTAISPENPQASDAAAHTHPVVSYVHRMPVDPKNWRGLNDRLSPAAGGAGS